MCPVNSVLNEWMNERKNPQVYFQRHLLWEASPSSTKWTTDWATLSSALAPSDLCPDRCFVIFQKLKSTSFKKKSFPGFSPAHLKFKLLGWRFPLIHSVTQLGFINHWVCYEQVESLTLEELLAWTGWQLRRWLWNNSGSAVTRMNTVYFDSREERHQIHLENQQKGKLFPEKAVAWTVSRRSKNPPTKEMWRGNGEGILHLHRLNTSGDTRYQEMMSQQHRESFISPYRLVAPRYVNAPSLFNPSPIDGH